MIQFSALYRDDQYRSWAPICLSEKHLLIVVGVNNSLGPLASLDATVEQDINLTVRATLELRQPDP